MLATPNVSAVIPVYNGELYVAEAIRSVLEQSVAPAECIVVDDGSSDATARVVAEFGNQVLYVRQDRAGVSRARNHGVEVARGEVVAFLDHDDQWCPEKLERQLPELERPGTGIVLCAMTVVDASGHAIGVKRLRPRADLLTGMLMFDGTETVSCSSTGLMRRADFRAAGGFDSRLSMSADWDLLLRIGLRSEVGYIDEELVRYRVHDNNMSRDVRRMESDMRYAYEKAFQDPGLPDVLRVRRRQAYARLFRMLAGSYQDRGDLMSLARTLARAVAYDPAVLIELATRRYRSS